MTMVLTVLFLFCRCSFNFFFYFYFLSVHSDSASGVSCSNLVVDEFLTDDELAFKEDGEIFDNMDI